MDAQLSPQHLQTNSVQQQSDWLDGFLRESINSTATIVPRKPTPSIESSSPPILDSGNVGAGGSIGLKSVHRKESGKKSAGDLNRTRVVIALSFAKGKVRWCLSVLKLPENQTTMSLQAFAAKGLDITELEKERDDLRRLCVALSEQVVALGSMPIKEVPRGPTAKAELRTRKGAVMSLHPGAMEGALTSSGAEEVGQSYTTVDMVTTIPGPPPAEVQMEVKEEEEDTADQVASGLGKLMMDPGGTARYMGHTSSPAFFARLSQIIPSLVPLAGILAPPLAPNTYHTADWQPLPILDQSPYELPSYEIARHYVALFFHHSGDLFHWADPEEMERDLMEIYQHSNVGEIDLWKLCTLNAMMAMGARHVGESSDDNPWPGLQYFARAKLLMLSIWEDGSISSVRCFALMSIYLLSASRRDDSYCYIGMALRACLMLGLHRKLEPDLTPTVEETVAQEQRRRLFWSVYCMERLISCALGRPRALDDDDIDVEQPTFCAALHDVGPPSGLLCNIAIRQIEGRMNKELYRASPNSFYGDEFFISNAMQLLKDIDAAANKFLSSDFGGPQGFRNPRARIVLKLTFNQSIIIVCRPALLHFIRLKANKGMNVMSSSGVSPRNIIATSSLEELQQRAITAARESAQLLSLLSSSGMILKWSFFDLHFTFNAVMILLLEQLLDPHLVNPGSAATISSMRDILSRMATNGNESAVSCSDIIASLSLACDLSKLS